MYCFEIQATWKIKQKILSLVWDWILLYILSLGILECPPVGERVLSVSDLTPMNFLLGRRGGVVQDIGYVPYSQSHYRSWRHVSKKHVQKLLSSS